MPAAHLSPQRLLQALPKSRERGITAETLADELSLSEPQSASLELFLKQFVRAGLAAAKGGRFWRRHAPGFLIGTLRCTRSGHAFVVPEDPKERERGDLFVNARLMGPALHEDTVIVRVTGVRERGREGRVEAVLRHANQTVIGTFVRLKSESFVSPIEERFLYEIAITPSNALDARDGDIVNVEITGPPIAGRPPWGRVIEILGRPGQPGIDLEIIIRKHHLSHVFPEAVLAEAEAIHRQITEEQLTGREDLRGRVTITIDGETARDFDDAVSLEELPNGRVLLGVHIADVSYYVREGSALDEEALLRGTSVYFPERAIPMLPERLSNDICSLKPQVDRLTMSTLIEVNRNGRVVDYRLTPSVIHSRERMTYTAVNEIITNPEGERAGAYGHVKT
jgi:ribonuclease R